MLFRSIAASGPAHARSIALPLSCTRAALSAVHPLAPRRAAGVLARHLLTSSSKLVQQLLRALESEDQAREGEDVEVLARPGRQEWESAGWRALRASCRELAVKAARALVGQAAAALLPPRAAWKALKDLSASSLRKARCRRRPLSPHAPPSPISIFWPGVGKSTIGLQANSPPSFSFAFFAAAASAAAARLAPTLACSPASPPLLGTSGSRPRGSQRSGERRPGGR